MIRYTPNGTGHRTITDAEGRATRRRTIADLATLAGVVAVIALLVIAALGRDAEPGVAQTAPRASAAPALAPALVSPALEARLQRLERELSVCRSRTEHLRQTIRWVAGVARNIGRRDERPLPDLFERGWEAWP